MSLDVNKLENVVELSNGAKRARCPACAEAGQDRTGEHLRIYPDGKFGCCVFAGNREHRKRIFALAGIREQKAIRMRVTVPKPTVPVQCGLLGRLGRLFGDVAKATATPVGEVGTLGTGQYLYTCGKKSPENEECNKKVIEFQTCVPNVPVGEIRLESETPVPRVPSEEKLPFLTPGGDLSIPFDSPDRYHWWKGGQSVASTRAEVLARMAAAGLVGQNG
jgi:hypothetical protein